MPRRNRGIQGKTAKSRAASVAPRSSSGVTTLGPTSGAERSALIPLRRNPPAQIRTRLVSTTTLHPPVAHLFTQPRSPASASKWSDFSSVYDRFRVLAMRARVFFPVAWQAIAALTIVPAFALSVYYDNDGDFASNFAGAVDYNTMQLYAPLGEVVYTVKSLPTAKVQPGGGGLIADSAWTDVGSAATMIGGIDAWLSRAPGTAPADLPDLVVVYEWDVEFQEMTA